MANRKKTLEGAFKKAPALTPEDRRVLTEMRMHMGDPIYYEERRVAREALAKASRRPMVAVRGTGTRRIK
jgi:hypothetical protein